MGLNYGHLGFGVMRGIEAEKMWKICKTIKLIDEWN
jgi:hypothetical protein